MEILVVTADDLATIIKLNVLEALAEHSPVATPGNKWMNVEQVIEYLGIPRNTLYQMTSKGQIPHRKIGKRLSFLKKELDEWAQAKHKKTPPKAQGNLTVNSPKRGKQ